MANDKPDGLPMPIDDLVKASLESSQMDRNRDYADRGRRFGHLSDEDVILAWKASIILYSRSLRHQGAFQDFQDLDAELCLRGIDPPYDQVPAALDAITEAARLSMEEMKDDPEANEMLKETLADEIAKFLIGRNKSQN